MPEANVVLAYVVTYVGILGYVVWLGIRRRRLTQKG
ncbi:MAG TPA: CcmD family protein [Acidimicrobiia bacterium]|jgi:CcmD family protein